MADTTTCPTCGSGIRKVGKHYRMLTLPTGWPINDFCEDCKKASHAKAMEAGRREAERIEKRILEIASGCNGEPVPLVDFQPFARR